MATPSTLTGTRANLPFVRQSLNSSSCNVATTRKSVKECLGSAVDLRVLTERRCREIMGKLSGPTGTQHTERVFRHFGMVAGRDYLMLGYKPWGRFRDLLKGGWGVTLFISYGYLNNTLPRFSGDRSFNGIHALYLRHRWKTRKWRLGTHDPLHDGRRSSIPQGPVNAPQWLYRKASERYAIRQLGNAGSGYAVGYAVKRRT